jgi:alpha-mannosidase
MRIARVESTELFGGTAQRPLQIVQVTVVNDGPPLDTPATVRVEGAGVSNPHPFGINGLISGEERTIEVQVEIAAPYQPGSSRPVTVIAEAGTSRTETTAEITVAEPGWTMWMVSHFHYDPVWWNTQGQFTQSRLLLPDEHGELPEVRTAFELVHLHLEKARRDQDYKFVLAEIDYLKPYFDAHPEDREDLRRFLDAGRVEIVGGNYNEPNTNLTSAESTIRNAVYGVGYQRDILGGDPRTAWMLDVFGHDPGYPGLMAAAGMTSSSWARGPFHQWGPSGVEGGNKRMQFPTEFEWVSPDGNGLLTNYMANHYGAGWQMQKLPDLPAAEQEAYKQFCSLAPVAATRNVMLPVGADHVIPPRWVTEIHRDWNARYVWPRFVTAVPREFFDAVRKEAAGGDVWITPQTRDMNPVYTGKDVSYIDTKQAQRAGEIAVLEGERLATLAWLEGAPYPAESLDKAWRQLAYGAHHDAITGTESDEVYLDLLGGWREAWERGDSARGAAAAHLTGLADTSADTIIADSAHWREPLLADSVRGAIVVFNTLARPRSGPARVTVRLAAPGTLWLDVLDHEKQRVATLAEGVKRHPDGTLAEITLTFWTADLPALGYRTYWTYACAEPDKSITSGWLPKPDVQTISNGVYSVYADAERGGTLEITDKRISDRLLRGPGNELVLQDEYATHPRHGEGPWHLSPKGPGRGSATVAAQVRVERCPIGSRLIASCDLDGLHVTQETYLWDYADHVEFRTHVDGSIGKDRMLRVRFPADVPGGLPVYQTATAVIGRPFGVTDVDVAEHWYTLDNPAQDWFGVGSTTRVALGVPGGGSLLQAIGVAEVIPPNIPNGSRVALRDLIAALAGQGVTATCSRAEGPRYGAIDVDSNLPDFRIALGGVHENSFTAAVLAAADPWYMKELTRQLVSAGHARVWVPAARPREEAFAPGADLRGVSDLPVLLVVGVGPEDLATAITELTADLSDSVIEVPTGAGVAAGAAAPPLADRSVALLNRGTPGCVVTPDGTLSISLMRSCSAWPSGIWIDGERRTAPGGSSFAWQHWSHTFEYALASGAGDWRSAGFSAAGEEFNHDLLGYATDCHTGRLPASVSLASVEPVEAVGPAPVALCALKPQGNPLAAGRPADPATGLTVRVRETAGRTARARVRLRGGITAGRLTDLLEESGGVPLESADDGVIIDLSPFSTVTTAVSAGRIPSNTAPSNTASGVEPAQPVFGRYWLHGKGPAPAGNLPVAVHVSPGLVAISPGAPPARLRVTVACGPEPASGWVRLLVPPGLSASCPEFGTGEHADTLPYDLAARGHAGWDVLVQAQPGASAGRYAVAAQTSDGLAQIVEDVTVIAIDGPGDPDVSLPIDELLPAMQASQEALDAELDVTVLTPAVRLAPGERGEVVVRVTSGLASELRGEAQLLSPFGSWAAVGPWTQGFRVDPGGSATLSYPVAIPASTRAGAQWWALVKIMYFGRVRYTAAVPVTVSD